MNVTWFAHGSPRMAFQRYVASQAQGEVLDVGCGTEAVFDGPNVTHLDLLDFSLVYERFIQADALASGLPDKSFDTVVLGDILEHVEMPGTLMAEAARLAKRVLCFTTFEETRLGSPGNYLPRPDLSGHCWHFDQRMIINLCGCAPGFGIDGLHKVYEVFHEGQPYFEWMGHLLAVGEEAAGD